MRGNAQVIGDRHLVGCADDGTDTAPGGFVGADITEHFGEDVEVACQVIEAGAVQELRQIEQAEALMQFVILGRAEFEGVVFATLLQQGTGGRIADFVLRRINVPGHRYRLADVVQERGDKDGVGPEVLLCLDDFGLGGQRQRVFLPLVDGVLNHAQGVDNEAAGIGVMVRLRGGEQLHHFAVAGNGLAVHRLETLRVNRHLAPDAAQAVVQAEAAV